jgi:hypothetical protein
MHFAFRTDGFFTVRPNLCFGRTMKAVADDKNKGGDFYLSTLAPVNHHSDSRFCVADLVILTVLFLEIGTLIRLVLAN